MNDQKGSILILTLVLMTASVIMAMAYCSLVRNDTVLLNSQSDKTHALYIAEAGLNQAAWYLLHTAPDGTVDGSWRTAAYPAPPDSGPNDPRSESFAGGGYTIWVQDADGEILITSSGSYQGRTQMVHELENLDRTVEPYALHAVAGSWGSSDHTT